MKNSAVISGFVLLVAVVGCSREDPTLSKATSVVFVGDSLAVETAPFLAPLLEGRTMVPMVKGGSAPCDWLGVDLQISTESVVVVSFIGNSLTPCMQDGAGANLGGQAFFDKYRADTVALIKQVRSAGAEAVVLVGEPIESDAWPAEIVARLNAMYADLASDAGVVFVDAGAAVENTDGTFATELPCLTNEVECGASGTNVVRTNDGVHLCPGELSLEQCPGYASGAFRFAKAIADAIINS
jgi:hypothetical protein